MRWLGGLVLIAGCAIEGPQDPSCGSDEQVFVVQQMSFVRSEDGISEGFDLDGIVGDSCGVPDLASPGGGGGIDNAFSFLLPALELTEAAAVELLLQEAIDTGQLLLTLELSGLDDVADDACVGLQIGRAVGPPMLGTDGRLLWGQTLAADDTLPAFDAGQIPLQGGQLEAGAALSLPMEIFGVPLQLDLLGGRMRAVIEPDGAISGLFSGGVAVDYVLQVAREENVDPSLAGILETLLGQFADLAPDEQGACTQFSVGIAYRAVPAFLLR